MRELVDAKILTPKKVGAEVYFLNDPKFASWRMTCLNATRSGLTISTMLNAINIANLWIYSKLSDTSGFSLHHLITSSLNHIHQNLTLTSFDGALSLLSLFNKVI
jgi:hypothetical protein